MKILTQKRNLGNETLNLNKKKEILKKKTKKITFEAKDASEEFSKYIGEKN